MTAGSTRMKVRDKTKVKTDNERNIKKLRMVGRPSKLMYRTQMKQRHDTKEWKQKIKEWRNGMITLRKDRKNEERLEGRESELKYKT